VTSQHCIFIHWNYEKMFLKLPQYCVVDLTVAYISKR